MIKIIIQSIEGREEFHMPVAEAADFIKDQCENKGIWAYWMEIIFIQTLLKTYGHGAYEC